MIIEYTFSSLLNKHTIRTKGITLKGRGVKQFHSESLLLNSYNVYSVTTKAFDRINKSYPSMKSY